MSDTAKVLVVRARRDPLPGLANPGPHQTYKDPVLSVEERTLGPLDPEEIRVGMIYAGICGTDVHLVETNPATGYVRCSAPADIPPEGRVLGHEGVGRVLAVGSAVRHLAPGALVTFESIIVCHFCDVCRRGQFNQCLRARLLGLEKDGLFGSVVDVPATLAHDVGFLGQSDDALRAAACVEPAGVAYVACQNTRLSAGEVVVVFGAGPIGLYAAMLAKLVFGASRVHVVEPVAFRREFAKPWCDRAWDVQEFFADPPAAVDVVIEAAGGMENLVRVFRRLAPNGRVALLARSGAPLVLDAVDHMITNAISLVGSRGHLCGAFAKILSLFESGRLPLQAIVTRVLDGPEALKSALAAPGHLLTDNCKVLARLDGGGGGGGGGAA